jgi:hypothetical protein
MLTYTTFGRVSLGDSNSGSLIIQPAKKVGNTSDQK